MVNKVELTKVGKKELEEEYRYLVDVVRNEVKQQLAEARAQGDLSENADYDAARDRQAQVESRIKEIENILANAVIIDEDGGRKKGNKISLGSTVTIRFLNTGKEEQFMIVGTVESDPFNHKISNQCALGVALIGKSLGDIVVVKGKEEYQVEVIKIGA